MVRTLYSGLPGVKLAVTHLATVLDVTGAAGNTGAWEIVRLDMPQ